MKNSVLILMNHREKNEPQVRCWAMISKCLSFERESNSLIISSLQQIAELYPLYVQTEFIKDDLNEEVFFIIFKPDLQEKSTLIFLKTKDNNSLIFKIRSGDLSKRVSEIITGEKNAKLKSFLN